MNGGQQRIIGRSSKRQKAFDSWFEVDVALELLRRDYFVIPQYEVAGKFIDLVVEGGHAQVAVECDGDEWHGPDQYEADMQRQRMLERCGRVFFRVRESSFRWNRQEALSGLWRLLEERDIFPGPLLSHAAMEEDEAEDEFGPDQEEEGAENEEELEGGYSLFHDTEVTGGRLRRRPENISASEIQDAIVHSLEQCPNHSCTLQSLTSRVLRELKVITRGNPRLEFEKRVMRNLGILENKEVIEKYRAKNRRVRLLKSSP